MDRNRVYILHWHGPFPNLDKVKEWEDAEGNDTYLYMIQGKKKNAKKLTTYYCGQAFKQSAGKRMKNKGHHIEEVSTRIDNLKIWVAKFENIKPKKSDVNIVENMFISFMYQCMIGKNEEVMNETSLLAPQRQLYIINEWFDKKDNEIDRYPRGSIFSKIPDVMIYYPNGTLYTSNKISYFQTMKL